MKKGHGSGAVGFEFEIILQCGCQYDSYVTFQLEVLTGYFWINNLVQLTGFDSNVM